MTISDAQACPSVRYPFGQRATPQLTFLGRFYNFSASRRTKRCGNYALDVPARIG